MQNNSYQWNVIQYLKKGFWIQETHDLSNMEVDRSVTNGDDDVMSVKQTTIKSLLRKGIIEERGSWSPCLQIDITKFHLKQQV